MAVIVWNEAKTIGVVLNFEDQQDSRDLAYELRKGSDSNTLGLIRTPALMEGWSELTAEENCTIEEVK